MADYSIKTDRAGFFSALRGAKGTVALLEEYLKYDGILYGDQIAFMQQIFRDNWRQEGRAEDPINFLSANGDVSRTFLESEFPKLAENLFAEMNSATLTWTEILAETPNQYQEPLAPIPPSLRLRRPTRSAFRICKGTLERCSLFTFPHGYQLFQNGSCESLVNVRSRSFSKSILRYPKCKLKCPVVVIQDVHDGGNFCHFLYDWLPRVIYFIKSGLEPLSEVVFVMGGIASEFQRLLVSLVVESYGLHGTRFMFPTDRMILDITGPVYFFSDQVRDQLHPAHMAHPQTIRILKDLIGDVTQEKSPYRRLFISRADASLRQITNERDLISRLELQGFVSVRLSEYGARDQVALIRGADILVGGHGMGFTHMLAHEGGLKIVELFHPHIGSDAYIFIGKALGFEHRSVFGIDASDNKAGYMVDPATVESQLS